MELEAAAWLLFHRPSWRYTYVGTPGTLTRMVQNGDILGRVLVLGGGG